MRGFAGAWLLGTGLVVWKQVHAQHRPPTPGSLLAVTGLFAALALLADLSPAARQPITLLAWGLDVAGVLGLWPQGLSGDVTAATAASTPSGTSTTGAPTVNNALNNTGGVAAA